MSDRQIVGLAAVACAACCLGPILGILGAIVALGLVSSLLIGVAGLVIASAAITAFFVARHRSKRCGVEAVPVRVELGHRSR